MQTLSLRRALGALLFVSMSLVVGCGGGGGSPEAPAPTIQAPTITSHPSNVATVEGASATFTVVASGAGPLIYQWKRNGVDIAGANAASLNLATASPFDNMSTYSVTVSNPGGTVTSDPATLFVGSAAINYTHPADAAASLGQSVTFKVSAGSGGPLQYQWRRNGVDIAGATSNQLSIAAAEAADHAATYSVAISNGAVTVTSRPAVLLVDGSGKLAVHAGQLGGTGNADGPRRAARFSDVTGLFFDGEGRLLVADGSLVRRIDVSSAVSTVAGKRVDDGSLWPGVDGAAGTASFFGMSGIVADGLGNVYVGTRSAVRKVASDGSVSTLAGNLVPSLGGADGVGPAARFNNPGGLAIDAAGNIYVADIGNYAVRRITPAGAVTTVAGSLGMSGYTDATGHAARFSAPRSVAIDSVGNIYVADAGFNSVIRKISPTGEVSTLAGSPGVPATTDGTGAAARFTDPSSMALGPDGNLYVLQTQDGAVRKVTPDGVVTTVGRFEAWAGYGYSLPTGIAIHANGDIYAANTYTDAIYRMSPDGQNEVYAGVPAVIPGYTARPESFSMPTGLAFDSDGYAYVTQWASKMVLKVSPTGAVSSWAGSGFPGTTDGTTSNAAFTTPRKMAVDPSNNLYVIDGSAVRKITPAGAVTTLAGKVDEQGYVNAKGAAARFFAVSGITVDASGTVYVGDHCELRRIAPDGTVSGFAGMKAQCVPADGIGASASFGSIEALATDSEGNVYVNDGGRSIRKVSSSGVVTTLAGSFLYGGHVDGKGTAARFMAGSLATDGAGTVYVADRSTIRRVSADGSVTTVAGTAGHAGFGGTAPNSLLGYIEDMKWHGGHLYVLMDGAVVKVALR